MAYSDSHRRHLLTIFRHVDRLLGESYERLVANDESMLFPPDVADATPEQRAAIAETLAEFRRVIQTFMQAHGIRDEYSKLSALWSFRTALDYAWSVLEEIEPGRLAAYGQLDAADAEAARQAMEDLQTLLMNLAESLKPSKMEPPHA